MRRWKKVFQENRSEKNDDNYEEKAAANEIEKAPVPILRDAPKRG